MKKLLLSFFALLLLQTSYAGLGCTPPTATGSPNVTPPTENLPCVVQGDPYSATINIENFSSFSLSLGSGTVDSLRIDSLTNLPCGIDYVVSPDPTLNSGQTGCILLYGTSYERPGQYRTGIYLTVFYQVTVFGNTTRDSLSGRADSLVATLQQLTGQNFGIDFNYWLRVRTALAACPPIDTTGATDSIASIICAPGAFLVDITGNTDTCAGASVTVTASVIGSPVQPLTYEWSNGATTASTTITAPGIIVCTVTDGSSVSDVDSFTVGVIAGPLAALSTTVNGAVVSISNNSTGNTTSSTIYIPGVDTLPGNTPSYSFATAGTYDIILEASNACGSDRDTSTVTISSLIGCSPRPATGTPGITPTAANIPCANIGQYYDTTIYIENFDTYSTTIQGFPITITIDSLRIDSITNIPCGLNYALTPADGTLDGGATGCINLYGTTLDNPGQYQAGIYIHIWVTAPVIGSLDFQGRADSLLAVLAAQGINLPIDFRYWVRVKQPASNCPAIDQSGASNLTASAFCVPGVFDVNISGNSQTCIGATTTLTASIQGLPLGGAPFPQVLWSTGASTNSITVTAPDTVWVSVTDSVGTVERDTFIVEGLLAPEASIDVDTNGAQVTLTNTSTNNPNANATIYQIPGVDTLIGGNIASVTFTANGTYTITMITSNSCGSDTVNTDVTITGVSVPEINKIDARVAVYPNPNNGLMTLMINAAVNTENYTVKVYSMQGQEVYKANFNGNVTATIDLGTAAAGVYFMHINSENVSTIKKLVIK
ncbi:MAG: T9SS type A sorting domain-containing protein [Chitinophagales bacterium]|nr:T9SS type A sorting domain-containing protein [Chitinophagales bacterium]